MIRAMPGFLLSLAIHYFLFDYAHSSFQGSAFDNGFNQSEPRLHNSDDNSMERVSLQLGSIQMESMSLKENEKVQEQPEAGLESKPVENPDFNEKSKSDVNKVLIQVSKLDEVLLQEREKKLDEPRFESSNFHESESESVMTEPVGEVSKSLSESESEGSFETSFVSNPDRSHQRVREKSSLPQKKPKVRFEPRVEPGGVRARERPASPQQSSTSKTSNKGSNLMKRSKSEAISQMPEILVRGKLVYPGIAKRRGWEGKVVIEFSIDPEGEIIDFHFLKKSPYDVLNREAVRSLKSYRFARDPESSRSTSVRYPLSFEFRLH